MIAERAYWLDLFTIKTWNEFLNAGATVSGFREGRWSTVRALKPGDYLLCYLTQVSRFVGVLEVTSQPYQDRTPVWKDEVFPCRVKVRIVIDVTPDTAVPIADLRDRLSIFQNRDNPYAWTGYVRGSPARWNTADGEAILQAIQMAKANPVVRPLPPRVGRPPKAIAVGSESFTVPADETSRSVPVREERDAYREISVHDEIQWLLLKLGNDMGLDVWVARNDRNKEVSGHRFVDLPHLRKELPRQFDDVTNRTIELIDVLWMQGNAIVAAFEIESTTSIYSGLLRMSDLTAMQPNLKIRLYLVAPDERKSKVFEEINRPTFSRRSPPLRDVCRFIAFTRLRDEIAKVDPYVRHLKSDFVDDLAEECTVDASYCFTMKMAGCWRGDPCDRPDGADTRFAPTMPRRP